jgi:violaxanthin de-epoxidase
MLTNRRLLLVPLLASVLPCCESWAPNRAALPSRRRLVPNVDVPTPLRLRAHEERSIGDKNRECNDFQLSFQRGLQSTAVAVALGLSALTQLPSISTATDSTAIVSCLFQKCPVPLGKCILNPKCLLNVACINTCNGRPDEIECQIQCGNLFENDVVGEFNKCAVSDMACVPRKEDDGRYPVPAPETVVKSFPTSLFNGRWYITAGQNPLFDTFPCQVHFFTETGPNSFVGKLNWRIEEPDGEFFTRDALQAFVQDPNQPGHLLNHDNEYLHYQDDWWIIDYEPDSNSQNTPPFAFVYYRGSNDAWDGYGGAVVYTRDAKLPTSLLPRLRAASQKVGFDFDKDFAVTDNSCPTELSEGEKRLLRERFAGKVVLQTEEQLQAQAVRVRGNAINSVKAQKLFFENELPVIEQAFKNIEEKTKEFEAEAIKGADAIKGAEVVDSEALTR